MAASLLSAVVFVSPANMLWGSSVARSSPLLQRLGSPYPALMRRRRRLPCLSSRGHRTRTPAHQPATSTFQHQHPFHRADGTPFSSSRSSSGAGGGGGFFPSSPLIDHRHRTMDSRRTFAAYGTNWKETSKRKKKGKKIQQPKKKKNNKRGMKSNVAGTEGTIVSPSLSSDTSSDDAPGTASATFVPPLFVLPTASPHVFVARAAASQSGIDPTRQLFTPEEISARAEKFSSPSHRFEYCGTSAQVLKSPSRSGHRQQKQQGLAAATTSNTEVNEVAFLGRSNVGKSSLLNTIMNRTLARTSKQPGRTQQAHYFGWVMQRQNRATNVLLGHLVDLPGYGYAVGPSDAVETWQRRTQELLLRRRHDSDGAGTLKRVYLLVDGRHGATDFDLSVMRWLDEGGLPYTVVLTKCDAIGKPAIVKHVNQVCMRYQHINEDVKRREVFMSPVVHVTSASKGLGIPELLWSIETEFHSDDDIEDDDDDPDYYEE